MVNITDEGKQIILEETEDAMLNGFNRATEIAKITGITRQTASKNMKLIHEKWIRSKAIDAGGKRKELIRILEKVVKDLSIIVSSADNDNARVGALNAKIRAIERQAKLLGLYTQTLKFERPSRGLSKESFEMISKQLKIREEPDDVEVEGNQPTN